MLLTALILLLAGPGAAQQDPTAAEDETLVPWTPTQAPARPVPTTEAVDPAPIGLDAFAPRFGGDRKAFNRELNTKRDAVLQALSRFTKSEGGRFADLPMLVLQGKSLVGKEVVTAGAPFFINLHGSRPNLTLGDHFGSGARMAVSIAGLSETQRKEVLRSDNLNNTLAAVKGRLAVTPKGERYLEASSYVRLGELPTSVAFSQVVRQRLPLEPTDAPAVRGLIDAARERLKRERGHRYVPLEDLILAPSRYKGQDVSTLAIADQPVATEKEAFFSAQNYWGSRSTIQVLLSRLPSEAQMDVFRTAFPPAVFAIKAQVRTTSQGAYFLEAAKVTRVGPLAPLRELP
ncbi:MAG: hypothetical protein HYZ75_06740 [Elusimicrobia bacterium]|nr:hypothetical protein [Elusimicrobiota bacterium]